MINSSKRIPVSELITKGKLYIGDGYRAKNSELSEEGYPFARIGNLNNGFQFENVDCIPYNDIKKVGIKKSEVGDVAFTSKGTIGRFGFVKSYTQEFVYSPQICFWRSLDQNSIDSNYLYYWMNSYLFLNQVAMVSGQTDMALYVNLRDQRKMYINLPPLQTQKKIASILSAYDDLIENNNQRIQLLEEMAEEIYKEWFVRLRFPGYETCRFFDKNGAEVGREVDGALPEGWEVKKLGELVEITSSKRVFLADYVNEGIPFYRGKEITLKSKNQKLESIQYINKLKFKNIKSKFGAPKVGDILITAVGTIGSVYRVNKQDTEFYFKDGNLIWIKKSDLISSIYLFILFKSNSFQGLLNSISIGSSQKALTITGLNEVKFLKPSNTILQKFDKLVLPLLDEIQLLISKNELLQETRDLLLPRLISGKLDVSEMEVAI